MCQQQIYASYAQIIWYASMGGSMPIFMSHMNSLSLTMWQGVLYTDDDADDTTNNNDNSATAWLHRLSWPFGQISQKENLT